MVIMMMIEVISMYWYNDDYDGFAIVIIIGDDLIFIDVELSGVGLMI